MCRAGGRRCPNAGGRSTQNTRKQVSRARAALRAARAAGDGEAIDAAQQRLDAARAAHQEAKAAASRHDAAGHGGDVTPVRAVCPPAGQPETTRTFDGSMSDTTLLTYPDGTRLVRKRNGSKAEDCGADPVELTDAEDLAPHVLNALGLHYAAVQRTAPTEVVMEYIGGRSGTDLTGGDPSTEHRDSRDGRLLGLADHVIGNLDRSPDNWIQTGDGRLVGIDHGMSFDANRFSSSPFAQPLYDRSQPMPRLRDNEFTPADMDRLGQRLEALRPEFERRGRADWHDAMMRRHREVADHATGTTDLITGHTTGREGDVTPPTTPEPATTGPATPDSGPRRRGASFVVHNINHAEPGAHVGGQYNVVHGTVHGDVHQYDGDIVHGDITIHVDHGSSRPDTDDGADWLDTDDGADWLGTDGGAIHQSRHHYHRDRHTVIVHGHHIRDTGSHDAAAHAGDVTEQVREAMDRARRATRQARKRTTSNTASGNEHVHRQVGIDLNDFFRTGSDD